MFTPEDAKKLTKISNSGNFEYVLTKIRRAACFGKDYTIIGSHTNTSSEIIDILKTRGWDVRIEDKINYTVHWE
jgi:hypothetical protein